MASPCNRPSMRCAGPASLSHRLSALLRHLTSFLERHKVWLLRTFTSQPENSHVRSTSIGNICADESTNQSSCDQSFSIFLLVACLGGRIFDGNVDIFFRQSGGLYSSRRHGCVRGRRLESASIADDDEQQFRHDLGANPVSGDRTHLRSGSKNALGNYHS